jgi:hypothetical protein
MLKFNRILIAVAAIALFMSCQKEIDFTDPITPPGPVDTTGTPPVITPPANTGTFTAVIDGTPFTADMIRTAHIEAGVIVLLGMNSSKKSMLIRVADSGVHSYILPTETISNVGTFTDSTITPIAAFTTNSWATAGSYGNLNITSIDTVNKKMSGTFNMKVYRAVGDLQRNITTGVFTDITYTTVADVPPPNSTDSFRVKIDGVNFNYTTLTGFDLFGMINLSASNSGGYPTVGISVPSTVTPGTHAFSIASYVGLYNISSSLMSAADTGSVTILEHNTATKRIRGNFHFLANKAFTNDPPDYQLTEGYFSVKYQ